ncbi:hypothetical protein GCM10020221_23600 [Streptomyces thioluteus]|uniref:Uncharacterized protein n=1 Tax=Streptomyces thioluteus TaxID=66431 RepID=A0ABN3WSV1_STRTU
MGMGMDDDTGEAEFPASLTVDELAARSGVTGAHHPLLQHPRPPAPAVPRPPAGWAATAPGHLSRLALIEELQHQGLTLAAHRALSAPPPGRPQRPHDLAIHRAVVASWVPDTAAETTRAELERRAGRPLTDEDIDKLVAMDVLRREEDTDGEVRFQADPDCWASVSSLLDVPMTLDTLRDRPRRPAVPRPLDGARAHSALPRGGVGAVRGGRDGPRGGGVHEVAVGAHAARWWCRRW